MYWYTTPPLSLFDTSQTAHDRPGRPFRTGEGSASANPGTEPSTVQTVCTFRNFQIKYQPRGGIQPKGPHRYGPPRSLFKGPTAPGMLAHREPKPGAARSFATSDFVCPVPTGHYPLTPSFRFISEWSAGSGGWEHLKQHTVRASWSIHECAIVRIEYNIASAGLICQYIFRHVAHLFIMYFRLNPSGDLIPFKTHLAMLLSMLTCMPYFLQDWGVTEGVHNLDDSP